MNFLDMLMHIMVDRKFIDDAGNITCTVADFNKAFNDTVATLMDAEQGGCEGSCDCHSEFENIGEVQADGHSDSDEPPAPPARRG